MTDVEVDAIVAEGEPTSGCDVCSGLRHYHQHQPTNDPGTHAFKSAAYDRWNLAWELRDTRAQLRRNLGGEPKPVIVSEAERRDIRKAAEEEKDRSRLPNVWNEARWLDRFEHVEYQRDAALATLRELLSVNTGQPGDKLLDVVDAARDLVRIMDNGQRTRSEFQVLYGLLTELDGEPPKRRVVQHASMPRVTAYLVGFIDREGKYVGSGVFSEESPTSPHWSFPIVQQSAESFQEAYDYLIRMVAALPARFHWVRPASRATDKPYPWEKEKSA